jgi:hypothetical protein
MNEQQPLSETSLRPGLLKERRLARMRLGQAAYEVVNLPSDPEIRVALVPLNEAEHETCLALAAAMEIPDNIAGLQLRDRALQLETLALSIRDPRDPTTQIYKNGKEVSEDLEPVDVGFLMDYYNELADSASPSIERLTDEQVGELKKALARMDWNELSGRQWYAASRFLSVIMPVLLAGSSVGSGSISKSTTTNE